MIVSAKNVILNTTLDQRAGMNTLRLYIPEKYLKGTVYAHVYQILDNRQIWSKELRDSKNPIEITLRKNDDNYTGDVYLTLSSLPDFKFFFTIKNEGFSKNIPKNAKSFYPSDTVFIDRIPVVELSEIDVDEIADNAKADAKTVINIEEMKKSMFGDYTGKFEDLHNYDPSDMNDFTIDNPSEGTFETAVEYLAWNGILNTENDGMWRRWLSDAKMTNSNLRYKNDPNKNNLSTYERIKLWDYFVYLLTNGYSVEGDENIEHHILGRIVREHDEMKRIVKQLAATANIEHTLDKSAES